MVSEIPDEDRRRISMMRCPRFLGCPCTTCPLDPDLNKVRSITPGPLCYWWTVTCKLSDMWRIPHFLLRPLLTYTVILLEMGFLTVDGIKLSR